MAPSFAEAIRRYLKAPPFVNIPPGLMESREEPTGPTWQLPPAREETKPARATFRDAIGAAMRWNR